MKKQLSLFHCWECKYIGEWEGMPLGKGRYICFHPKRETQSPSGSISHPGVRMSSGVCKYFTPRE